MLVLSLGFFRGRTVVYNISFHAYEGGIRLCRWWKKLFSLAHWSFIYDIVQYGVQLKEKDSLGRKRFTSYKGTKQWNMFAVRSASVRKRKKLDLFHFVYIAVENKVKYE